MKEKTFVIILAIITFFAFNDALPTDIMEARNIVTAREIASDGNWLVPTMNGELRLEKPPLPTWIAGAIEEVCPGSLSAQRAAAGVMGLVWTLFLYLFAELLSRNKRFALLTVMVFLTSYHVVVMGRTATWDIYCQAFMMGGIYFLARGLLAPSASEPLLKSDGSRKESGMGERLGQGAKEAWLWFPLAGLMMGLSFMSKGPVSFYALLLPALIAIIAFMRPTMKGKWAAFAVMTAICLVVSGWWYAYLFIYRHAAVEAVIHKESGAWTGHNVRPWYYYWRFFTETGVWAVLMLAALAVPYWKRVVEDRRTYLFSVSWTLAALVLLSLMPEKKIRYLLPLMAPCALCVACLLAHFETAKDKPSQILLRVNGALVTIIAIAMPVAAAVLKWVGTPLAVVLCLLFGAIAAYTAIATGRLLPRRMVYGVCMIFMLTELFLLKPVGKMFGNPAMRSISTTQDMPALRHVPFYHPAGDTLRIEIAYEAGKKILPLCTADSAQVVSRLPFALVTHKSAAQVLPANALQQVDTVSLGTFDDNKHPKRDRHYTQDFVYHVIIISKKHEQD